MMQSRNWARALIAGIAIALAFGLAGCGSSGTPEVVVPPPPPPSPELALMFDSLGRQVPEAEFGRGDAQAAGADGVAYDGAALANAQVTLTDGAGTTRTTTTDASGYYRVDIKSLRPPFVLKVKRAGGNEWQSASAEPPRARGFITINASGLTDKTVAYVAGGLNADTLAAAKARLRTALTVPLVNASLDPAVYDPVTTPLSASGGHATFLSVLGFNTTADGSKVVVATLAGRHGGFADGAAVSALFNLPGAIAQGSSGDIYVADTGNHRIRKISRSGVVSTLAGDGSQSHTDGPGAIARFNSPSGVAVDSAGTVYVADTGNNVIRKVTVAGVVSTLAGSGAAGFANGTGAGAVFNAPGSIAIDRDGNLVVSDRGNDSVRKVTPAGVVTTLAGTGPVTNESQFLAQGFNQVRDLAVDPSGTIHAGALCPSAGNRMRFCVITIAPDGTVTRTSPFRDRFFPALGIAIDGNGNLFAGYTNTIVKLTPAGVETTLAGDANVDALTQPARVDRFRDPGSIVLDATGNLVIADTGNSTIKLLLP